MAGRDVGGVVDDIRQRVDESVTLPEGYYLEYGGQFESAAEATRTFGLLSLLSAGEPGNEIQRPLAIVVLGGLLTSVESST